MFDKCLTTIPRGSRAQANGARNGYRPTMGVDIVYSARQHAAVHKRTGRGVATSIECLSPRDTKKFIGSETNVIISADFAQLELRTIAAITGDETMVNLFRNGEDLHNFAAKELFGADFTKEQRQIAKVFNFSTLYGAGAGTIGLILLTQTGIKLPEHEISRLKRKWLDTFAGIARWQRQGSTRHEMGLAHRTPHGRRYISERFTDHLSIENQGAGAEVARIALHYIDDNLPAPCKLINFIHDSYAAECANDPSVYEPASKVIYDGMRYAWERAPFEKHGIEMPVAVSVAHNLKDADTLSNCLYIYEGE
jgi:DNA polymerase I-like protein with 3'-5' exonuclease and polymerase domains